MPVEPIAMCFSGGKDSMLALWDIQRRGVCRVANLVTTVTDAYDRVSMHGVRRTLLRAQATAVGIPLTEVVVPPQSSNAAYEREMGHAFAALHAQGIRRVAFGDIFLEDLRAYREQQLAAFDLAGLFPLWKRETAALARMFIDEGFEATVVCVYLKTLDASVAGRPFDRTLLASLPPSVDPCGENGEFHTFVRSAPMFTKPIRAVTGAVVERDGFAYCDLIPDQSGERPRRPSSRTGATS